MYCPSLTFGRHSAPQMAAPGLVDLCAGHQILARVAGLWRPSMCSSGCLRLVSCTRFSWQWELSTSFWPYLDNVRPLSVQKEHGHAAGDSPTRQ